MPASTNKKVASFNSINITLIVLGLLVFLMSGFLAAALLVAAHAMVVTFVSFVGYAIMHAIAAQAALNLFMLIAASGLGLAFAVIFMVKLLNFTNEKIIQPIKGWFRNYKSNRLLTEQDKENKVIMIKQHKEEADARLAEQRNEDKKEKQQKLLIAQINRPEAERLAAEADRKLEYLASLRSDRSKSSSSTSNKDKKKHKKSPKKSSSANEEGAEKKKSTGSRIKDKITKTIKQLSPRSPRGSRISTNGVKNNGINLETQTPPASPQSQRASSNPGTPTIPRLNIIGTITTTLSPRSMRKNKEEQRLFNNMGDKTAANLEAQTLVSPRSTTTSSSTTINSSLQTTLPTTNNASGQNLFIEVLAGPEASSSSTSDRVASLSEEKKQAKFFSLRSPSTKKSKKEKEKQEEEGNKKAKKNKKSSKKQ